LKVSGELHVPAALFPEKSTGTHWKGECLDTIDGLDMMDKRKISTPFGNRTPYAQSIAATLLTELSQFVS
jgi:hypothetical protein